MRDKRYRARLRHPKNEAAIRLENLKHDSRVRVAANVYSRLETVLWPHFQTQHMVKRGSFLSPANKQRRLRRRVSGPAALATAGDFAPALALAAVAASRSLA